MVAVQRGEGSGVRQGHLRTCCRPAALLPTGESKQYAHEIPTVSLNVLRYLSPPPLGIEFTSEVQGNGVFLMS